MLPQVSKPCHLFLVFSVEWSYKQHLNKHNWSNHVLLWMRTIFVVLEKAILYHFDWFSHHASQGKWFWPNSITCPVSQMVWPGTFSGKGVAECGKETNTHFFFFRAPLDPPPPPTFLIKYVFPILMFSGIFSFLFFFGFSRFTCNK